MFSSFLIKHTFTARLLGALIIFTISCGAMAYPLWKKGYGMQGDFLNLSEARNAAVSGTYRVEGNDGIFLAPERVLREGRDISLSNPLTPIIYHQIFDFFGVDNLFVLPEFVSILLAALFNALAFLCIASLFGTGVGFFAGVSLALMPVRIVSALSFGSYEFAMLFFLAAVWLYLAGRQRDVSLIRLGFASAFFALAALARNAFLISFVPFVLFDAYFYRSWKRLSVLGLPFIIFFGSTLTHHSWLGVPNAYFADVGNQPFSQLGEVFPDPYTAYHDRDRFLTDVQSGHLDRSESHFFGQWGYTVTFAEHLRAYAVAARFYVLESVDLVTFGGPLIFLLLLGAYRLYSRDRRLALLFIIWIVVWFGGLVYFKTSNWYHFLEIIFVVAVLMGMGMREVVSRIATTRFSQHLLGGVLLLAVAWHLAYADRWRLYDAYRSSYIDETVVALDLLKKESSGDVIAVGLHPTFAYGVYYGSGRSVIYFNPETVRQLIQRKALRNAFEVYKVKTVIGFPVDLGQEIRALTGVQVISLDASTQN